MDRILLFHRKVALNGAQSPGEWFLFALLLPFSVLYGLVIQLRNFCFDVGLFPVYKASVPVISVGNLAAGGTGKTPVVDLLLKDLLGQGKRPAVVSRGYGGSFSGDVGIVADGQQVLLPAETAGDEPFLLARKNPEAVVIIARKREQGIRKAVKEFGAEVIVLDDGFQHRAVQRDVDMVLLDAKRPLTNGWPLPAGMLREHPISLKRANLLLLTRSSATGSFMFSNIPVFSSRHELDETFYSLTGEPLGLDDLKAKKLFAFAGIADPQSFFTSLDQLGLQVESALALSDHVSYGHSLIGRIDTAASHCDALITTEKDAVKLQQGMFRLPCILVPMKIVIDNKKDFLALLNKLLER